jgi:chemotaxis protein methyltransferase CheR
MILREFRQQNRKVSAGADIVATDISPTALAQARSGEYSALAIGRGLDPVKLKKHFTEVSSGRYKINPTIAADIDFRTQNLQDSYALLGRFDVVFCRNVLIYFSANFKRDILPRMHATLNPGGYLLVGASEAVHGLSDLYEMVHCRPGILYKKI